MKKQTKKDKQIQIEKAVGIFRETLEKTYKGNNEFYGIGLHSLVGILSGKVEVRRKDDGSLKISGELGSDAIGESCKGLPNRMSDWNIYPLVITLFNKDIADSGRKANK